MKKVNIGDASLHVLDQGEGPVLLLVHGFPLDHSMWRGQIDHFSKSYRVLAPDLRGFGRSDVTAGTVNMEQMATDLAALLDALTIREPVCFCGLSMGGYVAWQFWSRFAHRLSHLILCDTRAVADTVEVARGRQLMAQSVEIEGMTPVAKTMMPRLFAPMTFDEHPAVIAATREVIMNCKPAGVAAAQRGMAERPDMSPRLGQIGVPALIVCGENDTISVPEEMRQIADAIPDAQYAEIPRAGHMAPLEQPDAVNTAIGRFLKAD